MTQEGHDPQKTRWLDTYHFSWSRFICREGDNEFEAFDYESLRWMQLHVRNASRPVIVRDVGVRRRQYDWPHEPVIRTSEAPLQRLFDAGINTLRNSALDSVVDGGGRERQQYSGDGSHQLHAIRYAFGERRIAARFLRTFSEGLTKSGFFLDCYPAYDRLARLPQRELEAAYWGPLLDHGVGFVFDNWNHYLESGDLDGRARAVSAPAAVRRLSLGAAQRGRPAAGRGPGHPERVDRPRRLPQPAQPAVRVQSLRGGDVSPRAGAAGRCDGRRRAAPRRRAQRGDELLQAAVARFWSKRAARVPGQPAVAGRGQARRA